MNADSLEVTGFVKDLDFFQRLKRVELHAGLNAYSPIHAASLLNLMNRSFIVKEII
jgi:hypothetical protein